MPSCEVMPPVKRISPCRVSHGVMSSRCMGTDRYKALTSGSKLCPGMMDGA